MPKRDTGSGEQQCSKCGASIESGTCSNEMCSWFHRPVIASSSDVEPNDGLAATRNLGWTLVASVAVLIANLAMVLGRLVEGTMSKTALVAYSLVITIFAIIALAAYHRLTRSAGRHADFATATWSGLHRERLVRGAYGGAVVGLILGVLAAVTVLAASGASGSALIESVLFTLVGIVIAAAVVGAASCWIIGLYRDLY